LIALLAAALAGPGEAPPPTGSPETPATMGEQVVRVLVKDAEAGLVVVAERPGGERVTLADPGIGLLAGELRGDPARFLPLRLLAQMGGREWVLYEGTVVLADARRETIAFTYSREYGARRIAVAPSARVDLALDPRTSLWVSYGWGGVAVAYFGALALAQAVRSRR
jgi:hypothetical protein